MRRARLALALVTAGAALVAPAAAGAPSAVCGATAAGIQVAVVVDRGTGAPSTVCVTVDDRATGAEVLEARARQLGTPPPRYENGLLCAIDGYPTSGCVEGADEGYRYWAYWHGDGSGGWTYSSLGPAGYRVRDGDVEGWAFQSGTSEAKASRPRAAATSCPDPAPTPTTTAPTSEPTTAATATAAATAPPATASSTTTSNFGRNATPNVTDRPKIGVGGDDDVDDHGGAPVGLIAGLAGALALAVAAGVRFRR